MRRNDYHLVLAQDADVDFAVFLEELREYERCRQIEEAQNAFLDAYSAWLKDPKDQAMNPALKGGVKAQMILCAAYLAFLDPTFQGPRTLRRYYTVSQE